jgi:hypothetical protein
MKNEENFDASYINNSVKQEEFYLVSVADPYPELADGDDLLVRVGGGRLVKVSPHHVHVVGQGPQVVVRLLTYNYGHDYRKPVLRIRIRIIFGCLDSDPHWGLRIRIQIYEGKKRPPEIEKSFISFFKSV